MEIDGYAGWQHISNWPAPPCDEKRVEFGLMLMPMPMPTPMPVSMSATPAEAWNGVLLHDQAGKQALLVEALDGLLVGYHIRR